jgi:hypothetical protein
MGIFESKAVVVYPNGERVEISFPQNKEWGKLIAQDTFIELKGKRMYYHPTVLGEPNSLASRLANWDINGPVVIVPATADEIARNYN